MQVSLYIKRKISPKRVAKYDSEFVCACWWAIRAHSVIFQNCLVTWKLFLLFQHDLYDECFKWFDGLVQY